MKPAYEIADSLLSTLTVIDPAMANEFDNPCSVPYLKWMCHEVIKNKAWEVDKSHRWIGYVQGVMCAKNWSNVGSERTRVRAIGDRLPVPPQP